MNNLSLDFLMNQTIANLQVLYTKLHCYHWYIRGEMFLTLHHKFEELYNWVSQEYDSFAERLLMIGSRPIFTLKEAINMSTIKEATAEERVNEMLSNIINDFTKLVEEMRDLAKASEVKEDLISADLAIGFSSKLQKEIWILQSIKDK